MNKAEDIEYLLLFGAGASAFSDDRNSNNLPPLGSDLFSELKAFSEKNAEEFKSGWHTLPKEYEEEFTTPDETGKPNFERGMKKIKEKNIEFEQKRIINQQLSIDKLYEMRRNCTYNEAEYDNFIANLNSDINLIEMSNLLRIMGKYFANFVPEENNLYNQLAENFLNTFNKNKKWKGKIVTLNYDPLLMLSLKKNCIATKVIGYNPYINAETIKTNIYDFYKFIADDCKVNIDISVINNQIKEVDNIFIINKEPLPLVKNYLTKIIKETRDTIKDKIINTNSLYDQLGIIDKMYCDISSNGFHCPYKIETCYIHGAANITFPLNFICSNSNIRMTGNISNQLVLLDNLQCLKENGSYYVPIMCHYEPEKFPQNGDNLIKIQQNRFRWFCENVQEVIVIIGVYPNFADTHIWDPLAKTKAKIVFINPNSKDNEKFEKWANDNEKIKNIHYEIRGLSFKEAILDNYLCKLLNLVPKNPT